MYSEGTLSIQVFENKLVLRVALRILLPQLLLKRIFKEHNTTKN